MNAQQLFARIAASPSYSALHPQAAAVFRDYLAGEKAVAFRRRWVINSHFPPFPGRAIFRYDSAAGVLEHLLKSGAGTVFYDAIAPAARPRLRRDFIGALESRHRRGHYRVIHDYIACVCSA